MTSFHEKAWCAWLGATLTIVFVFDTPVASLVVLGVACVIAGAFAAGTPDARAVRVALIAGVALIGVRIVLFGLTGHTGATTLVRVPAWSLPSAFGGLEFGGRVTAEVLAQAFADGVRLVAILVCIAVFVASVRTHRLVRLLPPFLFEAGLVVTIALVFVPVLLRAARDVREAQRMRGARMRGIVGVRALVGPVLHASVERAMTLAASMEARGFGRAPAPGDARARALLLIGSTCAVAGSSVLLFGRGVGIPFLLAGLVATGAGARSLARGVVRTRLRGSVLDRWDRVLMVVSAGVAVLAAFAGDDPGARWYAYPRLEAPIVDVRVVVLALALIAPLPIARARAATLRARDAARVADEVPA